ncbi:MAG: hypothetical protein ACYCYK_04145 [Candidatus Dormibacteria bacterium]
MALGLPVALPIVDRRKLSRWRKIFDFAIIAVAWLITRDPDPSTPTHLRVVLTTL